MVWLCHVRQKQLRFTATSCSKILMKFKINTEEDYSTEGEHGVCVCLVVWGGCFHVCGGVFFLFSFLHFFE